VIVEQKQRVAADRLEVPVVGAAFLLLVDLVTKKLIAQEEAYAKGVDKLGLETQLKRLVSTRKRRRSPRSRAPKGLSRFAGCAVREPRAIFVRFCRGQDTLSGFAALK